MISTVNLDPTQNTNQEPFTRKLYVRITSYPMDSECRPAGLFIEHNLTIMLKSLKHMFCFFRIPLLGYGDRWSWCLVNLVNFN